MTALPYLDAAIFLSFAVMFGLGLYAGVQVERDNNRRPR